MRREIGSLGLSLSGANGSIATYPEYACGTLNCTIYIWGSTIRSISTGKLWHALIRAMMSRYVPISVIGPKVCPSSGVLKWQPI
jgi:hypothetical protein